MDICVQEAVAARNGDMMDSGVTPSQAAFGRQPRLHGDTLGDFGRRLSEHSLIDSKPSLARQVAIRETARLAMLRMHFSKGLRRAALARSRTSTIDHNLQPGQIVYFFRQTRYNNKTAGSRKKLSLRRWHGPALLIAMEGHTNVFVSYRGQLTKCALEHVRPASSLEQVASSVWEDAIEEVIEAACRDKSSSGDPQPREHVHEDDVDLPAPPESELPVVVREPSDLPPLRPQEMVAGMSRAMSPGTDTPMAISTRRSSLRPSVDLTQSPFPQAVQQALQQVQVSGTTPTVSEAGNKRPAELDAEQLREQADEVTEDIPGPTASVTAPQSSEVLNVTALPHEVMETQAKAEVHPLRQLQALAALDRRDPLSARVCDHGTWRGEWPLPSRTTLKRMHTLGQLWPLGNQDAAAEVLAVLTARKEKNWNSLTEFEKKEFQAAAQKGWSVWTDNDAVEILPDQEAMRIRARLRAENQSHRILVPRFVMVDKNDGLRTEKNQLPLLANARLVVPGYQDISAYGIRCDAPTASRTSQHLLLAYTASLQWTLWSADIKSAFLKGEEFGPEERVLYLANIKTKHADEPTLPFSSFGLCRVKKGIFGLADSPRRWYQRLNKAVLKRGWKLSALDNAMWMLWSSDGSTLEGIMISHVDDLLMGGNSRAQGTLESLGAELGFGSISSKSFVYCGKKIEQLPDGTISVTMDEYHSNLQPVRIAPDRKKKPETPLCPSEHKQLRAVLGSLQWLVAQIRYDVAFQLSSLQGESAHPTVGTLLRANQLVRKVKENPNFALKFRPMNLKDAGIVVVSDASLGNMTKAGTAQGESLEKVYSQASYYVLLADRKLLDGQPGQFAILDARSHRLQRVCRSTFAAELMGIEEAMDAGQYCRGVVAEACGHPLDKKPFELSTDSISMVIVTDSKDAYDKSSSSTPSYGSQKSLAFTIAWIRTMLARSNTMIRWTSTENLFVDCGTKEMDNAQLLRIMDECRWCISYSPSFVKQSSKGKSAKKVVLTDVRSDLGEPFESTDPIFGHVMKLSKQAGWHRVSDDLAIHVCLNARSYRTPEPRFKQAELPFRTTFACFEGAHALQWRRLEDGVKMSELRNVRGPLGLHAAVLVTCFSRSPTLSQEKKGISCETKQLASVSDRSA